MLGSDAKLQFGFPWGCSWQLWTVGIQAYISWNMWSHRLALVSCYLLTSAKRVLKNVPLWFSNGREKSCYTESHFILGFQRNNQHHWKWGSRAVWPVLITEELSWVDFETKNTMTTQKRHKHNTRHFKPTVQFDWSLYGGTTGRPDITREKEEVRNIQSGFKDLTGSKLTVHFYRPLNSSFNFLIHFHHYKQYTCTN